MEFLNRLENLVTAKIAVIKGVCTLARLEAQLAGLSVFPLLLNLCMLFAVFITTWSTVLLMLGYFILWISGCFILSVSLVLLLNLGLLAGLLRYLSSNLKNMSFSKTREYFSQNTSAGYEKLTKRDKKASRTDIQRDAIPAKQSRKE